MATPLTNRIRHTATYPTQSGFTLFELMISVAVAVIALSLAAPSFTALNRSNKLSTNVNTFVQAVHLARSEGVTSGGASICPSNDRLTCSGSWKDGWIVFSDFDRNGNVNGADVIVRYFEGSPATLVVTTAAVNVTFTGRGFTNGGVTYTLNFCSGNTGVGAGRTVTVSNTGRPNTTNYDSCT